MTEVKAYWIIDPDEDDLQICVIDEEDRVYWPAYECCLLKSDFPNCTFIEIPKPNEKPIRSPN